VVALSANGNGRHHHHHDKPPSAGETARLLSTSSSSKAAAIAASPQHQQQRLPSAAAAATAPPTTIATTATPNNPTRSFLLPLVYGLANLSSVIAIVVANKLALKTHGFSFPVALTWCHTAFTAAGMALLARCGFFRPALATGNDDGTTTTTSGLPLRRALPVAVVYVGFLVLNNLSIQLNTVGFYQVSKIAITPVVVAIERAFYGKRASGRVLLSTTLLLSGVLLCSVSDAAVAAAPLAAAVAAANVCVSALYQVWASVKQRELGVDGMQLLHGIAPPAMLMLGVMVPVFEPVGWGKSGIFGGGGGAGAGAGGAAAAAAAATTTKKTLLTFDYTAPAVFWIAVSSALGLVVTATTFLFIGATSSLTYNVVGHLKTVGIVAAGVFLFGDSLGGRRLLGLALAMAGIVWYSRIKVQEQSQEQAAVVVEQRQQREQQQEMVAGRARGGGGG
jgi:solute carrier family 35 protein E3